jgi:sigma-B regulation protein RsbU (phosphoserine phosphatase)
MSFSRASRRRAAGRQDHIFRRILESLTEGVVVADRTGRLLFSNDAARLALGSGTPHALQADWSSSHECRREEGEAPIPYAELPLSRAMRGQDVPEEELFVLPAGSPRGRWLSILGTPLLDRRESLLGGVVAFRDITSRRESEESVRRLSNAVEQTADVVFITDREGTIEYVNSAFELTMGYSREEAIGKTPRILKSGLMSPADYEGLWSTLLRGEVYRNATVNRRKDGRLVHFEQTITPLRSPGGRVTHFVSVCKDMTERRLLHERETEMRLAADFQRRLYPRESPRIAGFDVWGAASPATIASGDYFDYIPLASGQFGIAIGDVSGHGLGAAFVMAKTRAYLRSLVRAHDGDIGCVLTEANEFLCADLDDDQFVTLLLVSLDLATNRLTYVNAGHVPGYVLGENGVVRAELGRTGLPLGIRRGDRYRTGPPLVLDPGDVILLCTDGATELRSPSGEFFEIERVLEVVREHRQRPASEIVAQACDALCEFRGAGSQDDDVTIVVCRVQ